MLMALLQFMARKEYDACTRGANLVVEAQKNHVNKQSWMQGGLASIQAVFGILYPGKDRGWDLAVHFRQKILHTGI